MFLAVVNRSSRFSDADARTSARACAAQLKLHVAPFWDMVPASVVVYADPGEVPDGADLLVILDDADQAGALGYHDETPDGKPYGRVFVAPVLDHKWHRPHGKPERLGGDVARGVRVVR